jgi:S1-C subfamily serine protease
MSTTLSKITIFQHTEFLNRRTQRKQSGIHREPCFFLCVLCFLLLNPFPVAAQCQNGTCRPAETPHPAVVRVINQHDRERTLGTGTLIAANDELGLVISCAHLFREYRGRVSVVFPGGQTLGARLLDVSEEDDLSALLIAAPHVTPVTIAPSAPRAGELLISCGFGPDGRFVSNRGQALGYVSINGRSRDVLELSGSARQGDSGGPIFNTAQQLAGVLFGTDGRRVDGTHCGRVKAFLEPQLSALQAPPQKSPEASPATAALSAQLTDLASELSKLAGRHTDLANQVAAIAARPGSRCNCDPTMADRVARLERSQPARPAAENNAAPRVPEGTAPAGGGLELGLNAWLGTKLTAVLVGFGLPGSVAAIVAWLFVRRGKKRAQQVVQRVVLHDQSPPLPQLIERNREFVEVQVPTARQSAIEWAMDEYVKRNPGARPTIETIEAYANQFQSAVKKA